MIIIDNEPNTSGLIIAKALKNLHPRTEFLKSTGRYIHGCFLERDTNRNDKVE